MASPVTGSSDPVARRLLRQATLVFWDFDGVVKESVHAKTEGYFRLFLPYGDAMAARVRGHHEANGGVSRFEKIPLYLSWTGEPATAERVQELCERFSGLVLRAVIDSAWVPGVREYLQTNARGQYFALVTSTPQEEIRFILETLGLVDCFRDVFGAPTTKVSAINTVLARTRTLAANALMVGDSASDLEAATATGVPFLLRRTSLNGALRARPYPSFQDLSDE